MSANQPVMPVMPEIKKVKVRFLTPRQRDVELLLMAGLPNKSIAKKIGTRVQNVAADVSTVLHVRGVRSRSELMAQTYLHRIADLQTEIDRLAAMLTSNRGAEAAA